MPRGRSSGQVAQRQDKKDTEQSQELQLRFVREHGVGSWYYRLRIGRMRTGEWLYLKRHPYEDREDAIVILCADGEQVASVADDDLWKYAGVQETTAKFVRAGQLIPRGPHRLTMDVLMF